MVRAYLQSAVAGAFLLGFATAALAGKGEFNDMCAQWPSPWAKTYRPTAPSMGSI